MTDLPETRRSADPDRRYLKNAMRTPLLEREEEHELALAWSENQDEAALHRLTSAYMRLVISIAAKFKNYGLPFPDLIQEGNIGLMQAAARFEPDREVRFSTYASWWIRSCIQDYVLRNWSIVRTGTTSSHKTLFFNLRRMRALIKDVGSGQLDPEKRSEVAKKLKVSEHDVDIMTARLSASDRSLNAPFTEDGDGEWQDLLADENPEPEEQAMRHHDDGQRKSWIKEALSTLSDREQYIITKRRLIEETVTLETLGVELGISKERVRQVEHQALARLKNALIKIVGDPKEAGLIPDL